MDDTIDRPEPATGPGLGLIGFAHRGAPAWYQRENTVTAFERALAHRATGLESDVWLTADGAAALHHDGIVGAGGRRVSDTPSSRLPRWLPTLGELY
nr:glycerophosphodiester phosphodiesterase family protein [Micromonospora sp. DSM 115978]